MIKKHVYIGLVSGIMVPCLAVAEIASTPSPEDAYARAEFGSLPVEFPITIAGSQILIDGVRVNGTGPYRFLLDTGGMGGGRIDRSLAEKLGLMPVDSVQAGDGSDRPTVSMPIYELNELSIGPATFHGVRVLSRDYNEHGGAVRGHIDGILGFHLFRELLLTIDYPARAVRLDRGSLPEPDGNEVLALADDAPVPTIQIQLGDRSYPAHLDTGAMGALSVPKDISDSLPIMGERRKIGEARTVTGTFPVQAATLDGDVRIGGNVIKNPEVVLDTPMRTLNIGGRMLEDFVLSFDQRHGRVRIERRGMRADPDAPKRTHLPRAPIELAMRVERGRPVIQASINGKGPFPFVLDTGSGTVILARSLVSELALQPQGKTRVGDPTDPQAIEADEYTIDALSVGDARFESLTAISWDSPMLETALGSPRGIIGLPVFAHCLLTIDYPGSRVVLSDGMLRAGDGSVPLYRDKGMPTVPVRIGEVIVDSHIDSGNMGSLTLPTRIEDRLTVHAPPRVVGRAQTPSGSFAIRAAKIKGDVEIAGQVIKEPEIQLTDRFDWGNIGYDVLRRFVLTFDQINERVRFAEPGGDAAVAHRPSQSPGEKKRYGILLALAGDGRADVDGVVPGGIAERSGLREGDRIVAINGVALAKLDPDKRDTALRSSPLRLTVLRDDKELELTLSWDD